MVTRHSDNDCEAVTYARGDSVATTTCNMMMIALFATLPLSILVC